MHMRATGRVLANVPGPPPLLALSPRWQAPIPLPGQAVGHCADAKDHLHIQRLCSKRKRVAAAPRSGRWLSPPVRRVADLVRLPNRAVEEGADAGLQRNINRLCMQGWVQAGWVQAGWAGAGWVGGVVVGMDAGQALARLQSAGTPNLSQACLCPW